jgi:hypothetical protein
MNYQKKAAAELLRQMRANNGTLTVEVGSRAWRVLEKMPEVSAGSRILPNRSW